MFIRDTFLGLLLVKPSGFSADEVSLARTWAARRSFDVSYVPGIRDDETNIFTVLLEETYTSAALACLRSESECIDFVSSYLFDIAPTFDDKPYFGHVVTERTSKGLADYQRKSVEALEVSDVRAVANHGLDGDAPELAENPGGLDGDAPELAENP